MPSTVRRIALTALVCVAAAQSAAQAQNVPETYFEGVTFEEPIPTQFETGEWITLKGSVDDAGKSAFLASMAHELRTPMNAIKGFTNLVARRETNLTDRGKENLAKVDQASDHLLAQINDLLDLSKIEAGRMEVKATAFDVAELVNGAASTVSALVPETVALNVEIQEGIGEAHSDDARLRQMLINLLSNAVKFTERGEIKVSASRLAVGGGPSSEQEHLIFAVSDTGKGIPEGEIATIFDEYRQVKGQSESAVQRGTGLGLSITRRFAELLGGSIRVDSEVGVGSTFTLSVPATSSGEGGNT